MGIAEEKKEILSLIEKLHPKSARKLPTKHLKSPIAKHSMGNRIAGRRQELASLRGARESLGQDLLEERLLKICEMLENRISKIERIISQGAPQRVDQKQASPIGNTQNGTNSASDLSSMQPDLDIGTARQSSSSDSNARGSAREQALATEAEGSQYSLSGSIQDGILPDILQMVSSNNKTGIFLVEEGAARIELIFNEGEIFHASTEGMEGQSAFFAAMALENGRFYFNETDEIPDDKTIDGNTQFMILEALRQIDENGAS